MLTDYKIGDYIIWSQGFGQKANEPNYARITYIDRFSINSYKIEGWQWTVDINGSYQRKWLTNGLNDCLIVREMTDDEVVLFCLEN